MAVVGQERDERALEKPWKRPFERRRPPATPIGHSSSASPLFSSLFALSLLLFSPPSSHNKSFVAFLLLFRYTCICCTQYNLIPYIINDPVNRHHDGPC